MSTAQVKPRQVTLTATQCLAAVTCETGNAACDCAVFVLYMVFMLRERKIRYKVSTRDDAFEDSHDRVAAHAATRAF